MPATNRVRIPSASSSSMDNNYLRGLPPSLATLQTALAIFALFVIARASVQRLLSWIRPAKRLTRIQPAALPGSQHYPPTWAMDEKSHHGFTNDGMKAQQVRFGGSDQLASKSRLTIDPDWRGGGDDTPRHFISRLPPAPPLTPPELSTTVFTFDGRPHSRDAFVDQPNPDYTSSTSTCVSDETASGSPATPRRRSYARTIPMDVPLSSPTATSSPDVTSPAFAPSSYPPSSPLLPPPPPGTNGPAIHDGSMTRREVDVKGEIISALDGEGAGWTRHTRVYGGSVCLACAASGGDHGGGFYGSTVPPEEMR